MVDGGGDGGNGDVIHGKDRFSVPGSFLESFLVGYGF